MREGQFYGLTSTRVDHPPTRVKDKDKDKDKDNPSEGEMVASCLRRWSLLLCADTCCAQETDYTIGIALKQRAERY